MKGNPVTIRIPEQVGGVSHPHAARMLNSPEQLGQTQNTNYQEDRKHRGENTEEPGSPLSTGK